MRNSINITCLTSNTEYRYIQKGLCQSAEVFYVIPLMIIGGLIRDVGQKSDLSGTLDCLSQLTLMHGAGTGSTAGENLAALGEKAAKLRGILIINKSGLLRTELANLSAAAGLRIVFIKRHCSEPPFRSNQILQ